MAFTLLIGPRHLVRSYIERSALRGEWLIGPRHLVRSCIERSALRGGWPRPAWLHERGRVTPVGDTMLPLGSESRLEKGQLQKETKTVPIAQPRRLSRPRTMSTPRRTGKPWLDLSRSTSLAAPNGEPNWRADSRGSYTPWHACDLSRVKLRYAFTASAPSTCPERHKMAWQMSPPCCSRLYRGSKSND